MVSWPHIGHYNFMHKWSTGGQCEYKTVLEISFGNILWILCQPTKRIQIDPVYTQNYRYQSYSPNITSTFPQNLHLLIGRKKQNYNSYPNIINQFISQFIHLSSQNIPNFNFFLEHLDSTGETFIKHQEENERTCLPKERTSNLF